MRREEQTLRTSAIGGSCVPTANRGGRTSQSERTTLRKDAEIGILRTHKAPREPGEGRARGEGEKGGEADDEADDHAMASEMF